MQSVRTPTNEKAARPGQGMKAATNGQQGCYQHGILLSSGKPDTADALGALLLYVLGRDLPSEESTLGWALVERWAAQFVDAKHGLLVGAA